MKTTSINGITVPLIGQGTWTMGEGAANRADEIKSLRVGIDHGMTLIDTAEMYGEGLTEELVGEAITGFRREKLYIVSKVYPHNANKNKMTDSCVNSLRRLKLDYLDLYLLHWRGQTDLSETVYLMEQLKYKGYIREWGVSNFDTADMEQLWRIENGNKCRVNQVLYHIASRGIEYDLQGWLDRHNVTLMAYCPLAQGGDLSKDLLNRTELKDIAAKHNATPAQILIAFTIRNNRNISIPRSKNEKHTLQNALSININFEEEDLIYLDANFPPPTRKTPLDVE